MNSEITAPSLAQGANDRFEEILVGKIVRSRFQPRKNFDEGAMQDLADSIRENGLAQPIAVFPLNEQEGTFELIAGERRWRAFDQILKLERIPAVIKTVTLDQAHELVLIENLQREDLTLMEEAESLSALVIANDNNVQYVASRIGKGRSVGYVQDRLVLMTLPPEVQEMISKDEINIAQAKVIAGLEKPEDQIDAAKKAVKLKLNADQLKGWTQNKSNRSGSNEGRSNTGGGSNSATVNFNQVSTSLVRVYETIEKYDFSMLRDQNKRTTLRNQITLVQRSLAETLEKLITPSAAGSGTQGE